MAPAAITNRTMFWRIVRRLVFAHRGRLFVILLALGAGAATTAALLNLRVDATRRLTSEFRAFGANVIIAPRSDGDSGASSLGTMPESVLASLPPQGHHVVPAAAFLYAAVDVVAFKDASANAPRGLTERVVLAGFRSVGNDLAQVLPHRVLNPNAGGTLGTDTCDVGERVASRLQLQSLASLKWKAGGETRGCVVSKIESFGGAEDNQVFLDLESVQRVTGLAHRASLIQLNVPGPPSEVSSYLSILERRFPDLEVRPLRQFTEAQAKI